MYLPSYYADSWVEISSQPSSSSLSSASGDNQIITTGLQIPQNPNFHRRRRRRRIHDIAGEIRLPHRPSSAAGSSQEEYDESDSESDQVMSSSNEDISTKDDDIDTPNLLQADDDDDDSTALGTRTSISDDKVFTPQPNAFSHPPSSQTSRQTLGLTPTGDSYFPSNSSATAPTGARLASNQNITPRSIQSTRPRPQTGRSPSSCNIIGPSHSYQPDHDAALRASLSTLLSCAAAVRGSTKQQDMPSQPEIRHQRQPTGLRLVPESELFGTDNKQIPPPLPARKPRAPPSPSSQSTSPKAPTKRKAREASKDRNAKKTRAAKAVSGSMEEASISPVLVSWMISAGVVLVFSAISFSVGYAWGKEVGRFEGGLGVSGEGASCGHEAIQGSTGGLRRLRWGTASSSVRA